MNSRERFHAIASFERTDDPFIFGIGLWKETFRRWVREGMPVKLFDERAKNALLCPNDQHEFVHANAASLDMSDDGDHTWGPPLVPWFEERTIEEDATHVVKIARDGATVKINRADPEAMPQWLDYPVKTRADWNAYRSRLDWRSPERWPAGWNLISSETTSWPLDARLDGRSVGERTWPLGLMCLTLYGGPRYAMGLEHLSTSIYDDPALVEEMMDWQLEFGLGVLRAVLAAGVIPDFAWFFEDMCYKTAPLVSPDFVRRLMAPRYRTMTDALHAAGVRTIIIDSDGQIESLVPIWLDCGINALFPNEVASDVDGRELQKHYGRNVVLFGNIDKRALSRGRAAMDAEIDRVRGMLATGGYFPHVDHLIPPDVPYEAFVYFLNRLRASSRHPEGRYQIPTRAR